MKPVRMLSGILTVSSWTLLSRILGFIRDVLIAGLIGPGPLMDAFVAAFRLPNMFRRFFAEGAFNAAFVPMFSKKLETGKDAAEFASLALSCLSIAVLILTGMAMVFMPALVWLTAEGFHGDQRFDITVEFGRIVFPYIIFISLAALFSGALNAAGRFAAAAAAPVLLNVMLVAAMSAAWATGHDVSLALVWTIPFAGVAQLVLVWHAAGRAGIRIRPARPRWTPEISRLIKIAIPAALAGGVVQVNLLVGQLVASYYDNAISWLYTADRLYQLPLGVIGISIGIVLLPTLSRKLAEDDKVGGREALSRAAEIALALTIPAAVALIVIPYPLVSVLFQRGAFTEEDSVATALALSIYGIGLPAFVLQKILQPVFFARENTRSPLNYALISMFLNAILAVGLAIYIGWIATAIATVISAWVMVWLLIGGSRKYGKIAHFDDRFHSRIWKIIAVSVLTGVFLFSSSLILTPYFEIPGWRWLVLILLFLLNIILFFVVCFFLKVMNMSELSEALHRKTH
ncbi:MAG: murein biosynthesis integral membrane protein MurJ [Roseovarius sp.]|nr:murein biosynthesis integral membrane protein MurJ [Roseovarius sp.]